jgi:hypothetical protein
MFNRIVQNRDERAKDYNRVMSGGLNRPRNLYEVYRRDFGFVTDADSRKLLYSNVLMNAAKDAGARVHDKQLIQQILSLVIKNGRIDHSASGHDDMVIAWLIGHWFLNHGVNLNHYGIDPMRVMQDRASNRKGLSPQEAYEREEQRRLHDKIEEVHERLKVASGPTDVIRLERELETLMLKVKDDDGDGATLDALLQEARESRNRRLFGSQGPGNRQKMLLDRFGGR